MVWPLSGPEVKGGDINDESGQASTLPTLPFGGGAAHHLPLIRLGPLYRRIGRRKLGHGDPKSF